MPQIDQIWWKIQSFHGKEKKKKKRTWTVSIRGIDMCAFLQELLQLSLQQIVALTYYCIKWDGKFVLSSILYKLKKEKEKEKYSFQRF